MSEYDRLTEVKYLRVRGFKAVRFCATIKALGINIFRITAAVKAGTQAIQTENMPKSSIKTLIFAFKKQISSFLVKFKNKLDRNEKNVDCLTLHRQKLLSNSL